MNIFKKLKSSINTVSTELKSNNFKTLKFNKNIDALTQTFNAYSYFGEEKHVFNNQIINAFFSSSNSRNELAVAFAYFGEGSKYRNDAIQYFEKYLSHPVNNQLFSDWIIYSTLATLHEKEYNFERAIYYLDKLIEIDNDTNIADYTRKGSVIVKQNINDAINYYEGLKSKKIYKNYRETIDQEYKEVLIKKKNGYVYKPRKNKIKKR